MGKVCNMEKILSVLENIKGYLPLIRLADLLDVAIVAYPVSYTHLKGVPVSQDELQNIRYFAMLADCYVDQCITDETGSKRRPCIPVFYREQEENK